MEKIFSKKVVLFLVVSLAFFTLSCDTDETVIDEGRAWLRRPGLGVSYSVEYRPGWTWDRNYKKYNQSLMGETGSLDFQGPFCDIEQFVALSRSAGADYHMLYAKWHDGICFFNTQLTNWKSPEDYLARFATLSREAEIPFFFYYSSIFDHNPQFDAIQPFPWSTLSFIQHPEYVDYLKGQYRELAEQYHPDGIWLDWYTANPCQDKTVRETIDFFKNTYPEIAIGFNMSSQYKSAYPLLDFTIDEIHTLGDPERHVEGIVSSEWLEAIAAPIFYLTFNGTNGWDKANRFRREFDHPWETISPVGIFWQDTSIRPDPYHLLRIVAVVMACGGRSNIQANMDLSGRVFDDHVRQIELVGEWYKPRKILFNESTPLTYDGNSAPGIKELPEGYGAIASQSGEDVLIHIIKREGEERVSTVAISETQWGQIQTVFLEPGHHTLDVEREEGIVRIRLEESQVDPVDTILRLELNPDPMP